MPDAVIVSTARTPLCKSWRGAFNITHGATLGGHALRHAIERARIDPALVEDVILGCANPEGATGRNIARQAAILAGCPVSTAGMTVNRFCSSGLQAIAIAAQRVMTGEGQIFAAGGVESISCVQNEMNKFMLNDPWILENKPELYWPMLQTAEYVASKYGISREQQDRYGVRSQQRAAAARDAGLFHDEIAPITTTMRVVDKATGEESMREVDTFQDEGIRADTTYEGVAKIKPAIEGGVISPAPSENWFALPAEITPPSIAGLISAGNASQFSDGAGVCIVMSDTAAASQGLT